MSEATSALSGAHSTGLIDVAEAGPQGMITVRGDLSDPEFCGIIKGVTGSEVPKARQSTSADTDTLLWMSPDELMLLCPHGEAEARVLALNGGLTNHHHLVENVSDARAQFTLSGDGAAIREVLAKVSPADMRAATLPVGEVRRTRISQVAAAFWFESDSQAHLICFRSVAKYTFDLLAKSSAAGSSVGYF
jgi:sarcosine oxidase subunit gamma